MLLCPVCKSEYQEGYKTCSNCKCDLIEVPEVIEKNRPIKSGPIIQFILGISIILFSPFMSYQLTTRFFIPNGNGYYDPDQFKWMLSAYHQSFLLIGSLIIFPCLLNWIKNIYTK